jgi:hypothetical protein
MHFTVMPRGMRFSHHLRAGAPRAEEDREVRSADDAVVVEVSRDVLGRTPRTEDLSEIGRADRAVPE